MDKASRETVPEGQHTATNTVNPGLKSSSPKKKKIEHNAFSSFLITRLQAGWAAIVCIVPTAFVGVYISDLGSWLLGEAPQHGEV